MVSPSSIKEKNIIKKITQNSMQTKYVQQKKFYKTLFFTRRNTKYRVEKENEILCIQCLGKIVLRIVLI